MFTQSNSSQVGDQPFECNGYDLQEKQGNHDLFDMPCAAPHSSPTLFVDVWALPMSTGSNYFLIIYLKDIAVSKIARKPLSHFQKGDLNSVWSRIQCMLTETKPNFYHMHRSSGLHDRSSLVINFIIGFHQSASIALLTFKVGLKRHEWRT